MPIIVTVTDANWHDKPGVAANGDPESGIADVRPVRDPIAHSPVGDAATTCRAAQDAIDARVNAIGGRVIGLAVTGGSGDPKTRAINLAEATGAVVKPTDFRSAGFSHLRHGPVLHRQRRAGLRGAARRHRDCPLGYTITRSGSSCAGVAERIIDGIAALASGLHFDVHVVANDVDAGTVDNFIDKLVPNVSGTGAAASMCVRRCRRRTLVRTTSSTRTRAAQGHAHFARRRRARQSSSACRARCRSASTWWRRKTSPS